MTPDAVQAGHAADRCSIPSVPSVFLSHNHRDTPFVRLLATRLGEHGVRVWVDEANDQDRRFADRSENELIQNRGYKNEVLGVTDKADAAAKHA